MECHEHFLFMYIHHQFSECRRSKPYGDLFVKAVVLFQVNIQLRGVYNLKITLYEV